MVSQKDEFFPACDRDFAFLSNYGFRRARKSASSGLFSWTTQNKTTVVEVYLERRDQTITSELIQIVDCEVPKRLGNTDKYFPVRLLVRTKSDLAQYSLDPNGWPLQPDDILRIVHANSEAIKDLCHQALLGNFDGLPSRRSLYPNDPEGLKHSI